MAYSDEIVFDAVSAHQVSLSYASSQVVLKAAVMSAILTAAASGAFTASVNVSSSSSVDTQYITALLNNAQYVAQVTGSNLIVAW